MLVRIQQLILAISAIACAMVPDYKIIFSLRILGNSIIYHSGKELWIGNILSYIGLAVHHSVMGTVTNNLPQLQSADICPVFGEQVACHIIDPGFFCRGKITFVFIGKEHFFNIIPVGFLIVHMPGLGAAGNNIDLNSLWHIGP